MLQIDCPPYDFLAATRTKAAVYASTVEAPPSASQNRKTMIVIRAVKHTHG